jgi:hypothetical protein
MGSISSLADFDAIAEADVFDISQKRRLSDRTECNHIASAPCEHLTEIIKLAALNLE